MAKRYLALLCEKNRILLDGRIFDVELPEGAVGIMHVWKTKKAARKWHGKNVVLLEIQENDND